MKQEQYIAQAVALSVISAVKNSNHLFCQELPAMDVAYFLRVVNDAGIDLRSASIALVGYKLSDPGLLQALQQLGMPITHSSTDLHTAAAWRNKPAEHPCIIALAAGHHPGLAL